MTRAITSYLQARIKQDSRRVAHYFSAVNYQYKRRATGCREPVALNPCMEGGAASDMGRLEEAPLYGSGWPPDALPLAWGSQLP